MNVLRRRGGATTAVRTMPRELEEMARERSLSDRAIEWMQQLSKPEQRILADRVRQFKLHHAPRWVRRELIRSRREQGIDHWGSGFYGRTFVTQPYLELETAVECAESLA